MEEGLTPLPAHGFPPAQPDGQAYDFGAERHALARSRDGLRHCPEEYTDPNDAAVAVDVTLEAVMDLDKRLDAVKCE